MAEMLKTLLLTSCVGTALAMILAICRPFTQKIFSSRWHYYMWLVVLTIMIFPIKITMPVQRVSAPIQVETNAIPVTEKDAETVVIREAEERQFVQNPVEVVVKQEPAIFRETTAQFFFYGWITVAVGLFIVRMLNYSVFLAKVRRKSKVVECQEIKKYTRQKVIVRITDAICSPLLIGVFRPTLLLPKTEITAEQYHYILEHECIHLKRQDVLYKWFLSLVKSIHWFNPAIYLLARQINLDCEISCDMAVVKDMNRAETNHYAETILLLLSGKNARQIPLTTGMTGKKRALKKRFLMMKNKSKISKKMMVLSVVIALAIIVGSVFTSGILNGKIESTDNMLSDITTDERVGEEFNFLVIGVDGANRADAILVFHFDGKILTGMNIPRNTEYIHEGDDGVRTIADFLAMKNNNQAAIDAIKNIFGIPIHYYAKVKIEAVEDMVDSIGGLNFEIPYNMVYDDPYQNLHIDLVAGQQQLTGEQVGHLLRFRDRMAENDEEIRRLMWFSVIKEVINQAVFEKKIDNTSGLYKTVAENIETNYPVSDFVKDMVKLQNSNRNNIVLKTIRGRNLIADGRFVFRINYVESESLLQIFRADTSAEKLISTITYQNKVMGFQLKLPEIWKSQYDAVQYDNQVVFYHKEIFEKYGKGSGMLFRITKITPPMEETAEPKEYLYWAKDHAYVWSVATDVQYPVWIDRDEEDARLAEDFEDMMLDLEFIKNSFSVMETQEGSESPRKISKSSNDTGATASQSPTIIKSLTVADGLYEGFEQLVIKDADAERIQKELTQQGIAQTDTGSVDLRHQYIISDYSYKNKLDYNNNDIRCDENGNISMYFSVNQDNLVAVNFYDAQTNEEVGQYGILANNENVYTFLGFDPDKSYNIEIQGQTEDSWKIEGKYIIY